MRKLLLLIAFVFVLFGCTEQDHVTTVEKAKKGTDVTQPSLQKEDFTTDETETEEVSDEKQQVNRLNGKVTNVVDGDTIDVQFENGKKERVRLVLVDTPETKHPTKPVQPFGPEASNFTKQLLTGKDVELELDVQERDKYGRILAYVYIDGKMINKLLLKKGLARVAVYPPNTRYVDEFYAIQKQAQKQKLGIWSIEDYVTDRGYITTEGNTESSKNNNSTSTSTSCKNPKIKGNINSKGDKIYHVPSGQYYDVTKPEELFCTEQEAINAGYRKSQR